MCNTRFVISVNLLDFLTVGYLKLLFIYFQMSDIRPSDTETKGQGTVSSRKKQLTQSGPEISGR